MKQSRGTIKDVLWYDEIVEREYIVRKNKSVGGEKDYIEKCEMRGLDRLSSLHVNVTY